MINKKSLKKVIGIFGLLTFLYIIWIVLNGSLGQFYMIWNIFLAWIPLGISLQIDKLESRSKESIFMKIGIGLLWVMWLLFYPNSPYIVTDFIHLSPSEYHLLNPNFTPYSGEARIIFNDNIDLWIDFINIGIGVWIGYLVGFISLYLNQGLISRKYSKRGGWIFALIVHILTGFAIYIGRFNRWNSWDVINPLNLIKILQSINEIKTLKLTVLFGVFSFVIYIINYFLVEIGKEKDYR